VTPCKRDIVTQPPSSHINCTIHQARIILRYLPGLSDQRNSYRSAPKPKTRQKAMQALPKIALNSSNTSQRHATTPIMTSAKPASIKHEHMPWQLFKRRAKATASSWASASWSLSPSPAGVPMHGNTALKLNNDTRRMPMSRHAG